MIEEGGAPLVGGAKPQGFTTGEPECSRNKGASLCYMIPLEHWNVERSDTFGGKSTLVQPLYDLLLALWNAAGVGAFQSLEREVTSEPSEVRGWNEGHMLD